MGNLFKRKKKAMKKQFLYDPSKYSPLISSDVISIICDTVGLEEKYISMESTWEEFAIDSLDIVEITMAVEHHYGIVLPDDKIEMCRTVGDFVGLVNDIKN